MCQGGRRRRLAASEAGRRGVMCGFVLWEYGLEGIAFYKPPRGKGLPLKK